MKNRLPAEWEPQQLVLLSFPRSDGDYGILTNEVASQHFGLASTICQHTPVLLLVADLPLFTNISQPFLSGEDQAKANKHLSGKAKLTILKFRCPLYVFEIATNDVWARDFGPITVLNEQGVPELLDFTFNGWGNKYPAELDNQITKKLANLGLFTASRIPTNIVLEGGSIESDGAGTIMATRKSLLNDNRNPDAAAVEALVIASLNAKQLLLLDHGHLENDDTDAHVDTIARFAPNNAIVYQACDDPDDDHYEDFQAMARQLATYKNAKGEAYRLYPLPWPPPTYSREDGRRLPAAYANFLITNGAVIVPAIHEKSDPEAVAILQRAFPDHSIILQPADYIVEQHGSIHCLTMQIPFIPDSPVVAVV